MLAGLTFLTVATIPVLSMRATLDEDMFLYWRRSEPNQCKPFTTYTVDCNKCVCSADGTSYCTKMACFAKGQAIDREEESVEPRRTSSRIMFPFAVRRVRGSNVPKFIPPIDRPDVSV